MRESILNGKKILAVDDEPDVLAVLEEEILEACPASQFDKASQFEVAYEKLNSQTYDLVLLDIMGVRGFDLLSLAVSRNVTVAMITAHALFPEALKRSIEIGARAYLPKEKIGEVVPFLEDILKYGFYLAGKGSFRIWRNSSTPAGEKTGGFRKKNFIKRYGQMLLATDSIKPLRRLLQQVIL